MIKPFLACTHRNLPLLLAGYQFFIGGRCPSKSQNLTERGRWHVCVQSGFLGTLVPEPHDFTHCMYVTETSEGGHFCLQHSVVSEIKIWQPEILSACRCVWFSPYNVFLNSFPGYSWRTVNCMHIAQVHLDKF